MSRTIRESEASALVVVTLLDLVPVQSNKPLPLASATNIELLPPTSAPNLLARPSVLCSTTLLGASIHDSTLSQRSEPLLTSAPKMCIRLSSPTSFFASTVLPDFDGPD